MGPLKPALWLKKDKRSKSLHNWVMKLQMRFKFDKCKVMNSLTWRKGNLLSVFSGGAEIARTMQKIGLWRQCR